jgi:hypothetical protein
LFAVTLYESHSLKDMMMGVRQLATGTLVGGVVLSAAGYMIFGVILPDFYNNFMKAGTATGVERYPPLIWAVALAMLSYSMLMTLAVGRSGALTLRTGMTTGAVVSFLLWFTADLMLYGISNVGNLAGALSDPIINLVPGALAGGAIVMVMRRVQ